MNDEQIMAKLSQIIRVGFVNARDPAKMRVKVTIPDTVKNPLITDFLPVLVPRASQDMQYDLPDIGDQVLCLFLAYGLEQGFVIGSMYGKQTPPVQSGDKWHRTFSDGAILEYDRATHELKADIPGTAYIKCSNSITLEAPIIYMRGTFVNTAMDGGPGKSSFSGGMEVINGGINVPDADVVASGVSLISHTTEGVQPGDGTSRHPTGGSAASPGTGTIEIPAYGTAAYLSYVASNLENLEKDQNVKNNPVNHLICCLPKIANAMAEKDHNELDKRGWIYLHDFFEKWLASPANTNPFLPGIEPMRVNFDWLISFNRSAQRYLKITDKNMLFSENARNLLKKRLKSDNKFGNFEETFDYINIPWWLWKEKYYQSIGVPAQNFPDIGMDYVIVDGLQAAMASFMFYALAQGTVEPLSANKYRITIKNIGIVAFDTFNFEGEQDYHYWRCEPPDWAYLRAPGYTNLTNANFQKFQHSIGRGCDFAVISGPKILDYPRDLSYDITL